MADRTNKAFRIPAGAIELLAPGFGGCLASDGILVEGHPVGFMYRETPDHDADSGWRFLSGFESDEYMDDPENFGIYDVNTIANYDPCVIPHLWSPEGCAFARSSDGTLAQMPFSKPDEA